MCIIVPYTRITEEKIGGEKAIRNYQIEAVMNSLGDQGWDLVAVKDPPSGQPSTGPALFFKRLKSW